MSASMKKCDAPHAWTRDQSDFSHSEKVELMCVGHSVSDIMAGFLLLICGHSRDETAP